VCSGATLPPVYFEVAPDGRPLDCGDGDPAFKPGQRLDTEGPDPAHAPRLRAFVSTSMATRSTSGKPPRAIRLSSASSRERSQIAVKTTFEGAVLEEVRCWLARPMVERVSAVEIIRRATWGIYDDAAPADWSEFLSALKRHGVRFLLVGAHALAAHGRPRATQDLDVLVAPTAANARRVVAALAEFGFAELAADWRWFTKPYRVTMLGRIPLRIDVLTVSPA
jgi:hypothetical protein